MDLYFNVAENNFLIREDSNIDLKRCLGEGFKPFNIGTVERDKLSFTVTITKRSIDLEKEVILLEDAHPEDNIGFDIYKVENGDYFALFFPKDTESIVGFYAFDNYTNFIITVKEFTFKEAYLIRSALMMAYTISCLKRDTLLMHASAVSYNNKGYLFLGVSGTGKSTHSDLWVANIPNAEIFNDDHPIIKIIDNQLYVYGSPWSGKRSYYKNVKMELGAIVRIRRGKVNKMERLKSINSYASIYASIANLKWSRELSFLKDGLVERVTLKSNCWAIDCLPNAEAAFVCKEAVAE